MRALNSSHVIVLLALFPHAGFAAIRPSFTGDGEAWRSTDIVVVSTLPTDGTFAVYEVWKGDLRPGARVVVPDLVPLVDAISVALYPDLWKNPSDVWMNTDRGAIAEQIPRQPVGSRMILFLKQKPSNPQEPEWEPGNWMGSMKASVVWPEGDQLCSFVQVINPGPSILQCTGYSLQELKERVAKVLRTQEGIQSVIGIQEGARRAQLLKPYLNSDVRDAGRLAFEELGKSGPAAVPIIREMLNDSAYADKAPGLIKAMVEAGGAAVGPELNHRFEREVAFWESAGPTLAPGWWNKDPDPNAPLRLRYSQTYQLIIGLQKTLDKDALAPAKELDDLWVSYPQLNDPSGLNQISLECEKLIKMLKAD
jgi:hypothetical protein